jgi:signal transduction histidine kinase
MTSKSSLLSLFIIVLFVNVVNAQLKPMRTLKLKIKAPDSIDLTNYFIYYEDTTQNISVQEAIRLLKTNHFKKKRNITEFFGLENENFKSRIIGTEHTKCNYWLALQIKNDTDVMLPLVWSFYNNDINFNLYDITNQIKPRLLDSGSSQTLQSLRKFKVRSVSLRFDLKPAASKLLMLKIRPLDINYLHIPMDLTTTEDYLLNENLNAFLTGRYFGCFAFAFFLNICLGVLLKNRIHFWHAIYILAFIAWNLNELMMDSLVIPEWLYVWYAQLPSAFFTLTTVFTGIIVFQIFIDQKIKYPKFYKLFYWLKVGLFIIFLIILCSSFTEKYNHPFFSTSRILVNVCSILVIGFQLSNIIYGIILKDRLMLIYLIISFLVLLSILNNVYYLWFHSNLFYIEPADMTFGFMVEIFLLTIVFAYIQKRRQDKSLLALQEAMDIKKDVAQRIIVAQEDERQRIAKDLHDDVGATLSTLQLFVSNQAYKSVPIKDSNTQNEKISYLVKKAIVDIRNIAYDLLPYDFLETGLFASIRTRIDDLNNKGPILFNLVILGDENVFITNTKSISIFRITNEIINNILKHSYAAEATLQLIIENNILEIICEDNGIGFENANTNKGMGLKNLHSRINYLNGKLSIDSNAKGTTIIIQIPID